MTTRGKAVAMNILLFVAAIAVSMLVVRIGAIAFELTGMEREAARFQALSCFTSTGFTTRESEQVVTSPQRRRVATALIIVGHAGLVTLVATFANALRLSELFRYIELPYVGKVLPAVIVPWANVAIIILAIWLLFRLFGRTSFSATIRRLALERLVRHDLVTPVAYEQLATVGEGYGVYRVELPVDSPVLGKTLREAGLSHDGVLVLSIGRGAETFHNDLAERTLAVGDVLLCYSRAANLERALLPAG